MKSNKTNIAIIFILSIIIAALLVSIYFFSFRFVIMQILDRGNSDTNNLISLIDSNNSINKSLDLFATNRDVEIIIVDDRYQVLASSAPSLRTQYFSNNISFAKAQGEAYSFIKKNTGLNFSIIYSKRANYKDQLIIISIEYPFLLYSDFKRIIISLIIIALIILVIDTYLITSLYINTYIFDLNNYVKNKHIFNEFNENENNLFLENTSSEIINLFNTLNTFKERYDAILENNKQRFSKLSSLLSMIPSGLLIIDNNKEITLMNEAVNKYLNIEKREILFPKNVDNLKKIYDLWEDVNKNNKIRVEDVSLDDNILEIEAVPLNDKYFPFEFIGVLFLIRDVTKTRELSNMKDEFVSNVSHELRTPLTIISGFAQALLSKNISKEDSDICINSINDEAKKMTKLINELLQISRIETNEKEDSKIFNPFEVVKNQVSLFINSAINKNINIQLILENNRECEIECNIIYFRQIINNLIDNAIKYSKDNTHVLIEENFDNNYYYFTIKDEGFGIEKNDLDNIFERFYRVEKSRNREIAGSGLGLAIVKQFVTSIGGDVEVESEINKGSTFKIKIKRYKENEK